MWGGGVGGSPPLVGEVGGASPSFLRMGINEEFNLVAALHSFIPFADPAVRPLLRLSCNSLVLFLFCSEHSSIDFSQAVGRNFPW